jgi:peptidase M28-like protein/PDZ domain-containing protein/PA domain-containing protein
MRITTPAATLLCLGAASVLHAGEVVPEVPKAELTPAITADQVRTRIAYLASDELEGRETGTDAGRKAEDYVAAEMKRFGLEPLSASAGSPFTDVPVPGRAVPEKSWIEVVGKDGAAARVGSDGGAQPFSFSRAGDAEAEVVFAGFGISAADLAYDDYAGLDVKGKVVLVLRHGPAEKDEKSPWHDPRKRMNELSFSAKAERAASAGAAGILLVNDCNHKEDGLPVEAPGNAAPIPVFAIRRATADQLLAGTGKTLEKLQAEIDADRKPRSAALGVSVRMHATITGAAGRNVVFVKRGTDAKLKDEAILVCAHMDHVGRGFFGADPKTAGQIHNGADDNASGTAALLEVAEAVAAIPAAKRTIVFAAWCGEEKGLLGSEYFVEHPLWELPKIALCVNMDMVGRYRAGNPDDMGLFAEGTPAAVGTADIVKRLADAHHLACTMDSWDAWEQSDHFSFYRKEVPSLFLHTGLHDDYHRPGDKWWKIVAEPEARIAEMVVDLVRETADLEKRPVFAKKPPRPVLGVQLADADGKGAKLMEIVPGLGANAAGLLVDDVITSFAGKPVASAADLSKLIRASKEGDVVEVGYLRADKPATVKVRISGR